MIPLRDENPTRTFPFVTIAIILANLAVFVYEIALGERLQDKILLFAAVPYNITHLKHARELLTLATSLFFHAGIFHIAGNMLYLWVFGNNIEDRLGHTRFVFFYLFCGIAATLGHILTSPGSRLPLVGASGAVSAVLGAYLLLYPRAKVLVLLPLFFFWPVIKVEASFFLFFWIMLQFVHGTSSLVMMEAAQKGGVAWFAHITGFLSGIVFLKLFLRAKDAA
jgi:membrane associated rhomboid family serine protease